MLCPNCKTPVEGNECPNCGTILTDEDRLGMQTPGQTVVRKRHRTDRWYKFLLYFAFFEVAVLNVFQGVRMLTGDFFGSPRLTERVFAEVPGVQALVMICAVLSFAYAGLGLFTRSRLRDYRKSAPWLVLLFYTGDIVIYLSLIVGSAILMAGTTWYYNPDISILFQIVRSVVMVICNAIYFAKRRSQFWV